MNSVMLRSEKPIFSRGRGLLGGQDAHHHVLVAARGGDGGHAQLDGAHGALEADLAVLGLALLGDVELRHDLEALHEGVPVGGRDLEVLHAVAVDAEPHHGGGGLAVGLDVDVRGAPVVGVDDDLVGELARCRCRSRRPRAARSGRLVAPRPRPPRRCPSSMMMRPRSCSVAAAAPPARRSWRLM